ncbi:MAG: formylglycine-generating enzyme family protein [Prochloraceae cyanobacterium]
MLQIPGGTFMMGAPEAELDSFDYERPQHQVNVSSFFMGRYPITQAQWKVVAGWGKVEIDLDPDPSRFKEDYEGITRWNRPVENVTWHDAIEFCKRLSKKTKREYRLPSEAQWEYACRAGTTTPFHFGETISAELANYRGTSTYGQGVKGKSREQTTPVGYFKVANNFGLYDMHGNVFEWCEDDWHKNYVNAPNDGTAWTSKNSSTKVRRGGSWYAYPTYCRSACRYDSFFPGNRNFDIGFRVVRLAPRTS